MLLLGLLKREMESREKEVESPKVVWHKVKFFSSLIVRILRIFLYSSSSSRTLLDWIFFLKINLKIVLSYFLFFSKIIYFFVLTLKICTTHTKKNTKLFLSSVHVFDFTTFTTSFSLYRKLSSLIVLETDFESTFLRARVNLRAWNFFYFFFFYRLNENLNFLFFFFMFSIFLFFRFFKDCFSSFL